MIYKEEFIDTIQKYSGIIHKAASFYTSSPEDREDLTQEIIYELWKSFYSFKHKSSVSTWIYRVAMNVSIYHFKQTKKRLHTVDISTESLNLLSSSVDNDNEKWERIRKHISNLNLLERGLIMLYLEGKSYKDIAEIIDISESNVGTKLMRIKEKLKNKISNN